MRSKKSLIYENQRNELINQLFKILNIDLDNNLNFFYLHDLDKNIDMQTQILNLEEDIKKYFVAGAWACFSHSDIKRKVLSIIRNIIKEMNYELFSKRKLINKISHTIYYIK